MNVENGQTVKEGDVVVIMEAMKMEVSFKFSYMKRVLLFLFRVHELVKVTYIDHKLT